MGFPIITRRFLFTLVSVLSIVNCQSRVKVIRPQSLEVETRFNLSNIAENLTFSSKPVRFFEYAQLPAVYQNERQPICDGKYKHLTQPFLTIWNCIHIFICVYKSGAVYRTTQAAQVAHGLWEEHRLNQTNSHGWLRFWLLPPIFLNNQKLLVAPL